jgi:hypothetical protein
MSLATHCIPYDPACSICNPPTHTVGYASDILVGMPVLRATCTCGATWVHEPDISEETKAEICSSHFKYASRTAMRID